MADTSALEEQKVFERLCSDKNELWWVTIGVDLSVSGSKPKAIVSASGDTGVEALKQYLYPEQILYGAIKVLGVDTKGAVTSTRQKTIFFQWVGPKVPKVKVAKAISLKSALASYFQGHHVALEVYDLSNLTEADLEARLRACGGAHQPDKFVFGTGTNVTVAIPHTETVESPVVSAPAPAPVPTPAPAPAFPKAVTLATPVNNTPEKKEDNDDDYISKPKGRAVNMFTTSSTSSSSTPSSTTSTSTSASHSVKASHSGAPNVDTLAAVQALGRAASRLQSLIDSSTNGTVSTADLQKFVAAELGEAAIRAAAALATHA